MNILSLAVEPTLLKGAIRIVHFVGLALGLGTATFLDLLMLRFMVRSKIRPSHVQAFNFGTKIVVAGLVMLWISGLSFLIYYLAWDPEKLLNPKIWAKLSIVGVLTANAVFLHKLVLPMVEHRGIAYPFQRVDHSPTAIDASGWCYVGNVLVCANRTRIYTPVQQLCSSQSDMGNLLLAADSSEHGRCRGAVWQRSGGAWFATSPRSDKDGA